ncbi:hypothetical protein LJR030_004374 [Rhizobium sp. LjRoot30]|uniref:hypothetical protein n=1 Tax=Rhizobium sp. LjRoot30 TaxID=3342320 RepID=UPI003ECF086D
MGVSTRVHAAVFSLLTLLLAAPAMAANEVVQSVELGDPVSGHADLSYADLLRQVIPDLASQDKETKGHLKAPLRHLIEGFGGVLGDAVVLSGVQALPFRAEGKPLLAIMAGVGQAEGVAEQPAMLAVFDMSETPKFLDAVDVGMDRFTGFAQVPKLGIGDNSEALAIYSEHFNAGEVFGATALTFLHEGKLRLVDAVSTYGLQLCATRTSQTVSFAGTAEKQATPYYAIVVTIDDRRETTGEPCDDQPVPEPFDNKVSTTYHWDAGASAFVAGDDAIKTLQDATGEQ